MAAPSWPVASSQAAIDSVIVFPFLLGPGSEPPLAVVSEGFEVRIFDRLARFSKDNTAGADVIIDRARCQRLTVGIREKYFT